jgi:two-component system response regulator AdeR
MAVVPRVVSVEDDSDVFRLIQHTLRPLDIELYHAPNGRQALQMANHLKPDLLLLDLALPDSYGWDVLKKIKDSGHKPKGVVVLSVQIQMPTDKMAQERQVDACMSKPFAPAELREKVRSLLHLS